MSNRIRCACRRCTIRGFMGPAVVVTLGVLLLLHEMRDGAFDFGNTYPFILIVMGLISLAAALAPMEGHIGSGVAAPPVVPPGPPVPPASGSAPGSFQGQGQ